MNIDTMSVNAADRSISINGEGHICGAEQFPQVDSNIAALHWHPERQGRCKGSVAYHVGGGHGIDEFTLLEPFVKAWEDARERKLARSAMEQAEAQGAFAEPAVAVPGDPNVVQAAPTTESSSSVSIAPEMHARLKEHIERVERVIDDASATFQQVTRSESERIAALEKSVADLHGMVVDLVQRIVGKSQ